LVHSHVIVVEPEYLDPIVRVLLVAILLEAWEEVIEVLEPILEVSIHPLDEVLPILVVDVMLQASPPARFRKDTIRLRLSISASGRTCSSAP
jgi:hypothetical protein